MEGTSREVREGERSGWERVAGGTWGTREAWRKWRERRSPEVAGTVGGGKPVGKVRSWLAAARPGPGMLCYITRGLWVKNQKHLLRCPPPRPQPLWIQKEPSRSQLCQAQLQVSELRFPGASVSLPAWCMHSPECLSLLTAQSVTGSLGGCWCHGGSAFYCYNLSLETSSGKGDTAK